MAGKEALPEDALWFHHASSSRTTTRREETTQATQGTTWKLSL